MDGKYSRWTTYMLARGRRMVLRRLIALLVHWQPQPTHREGYSLIIGCRGELMPVLHANLLCLRQLDLRHLAELIIVLDCQEHQESPAAEEAVRQGFPERPVRFVYHSPMQYRLVRLLQIPWINCWLSWCLGIAVTEARYAFLHDLDALLLTPDFLELRYQAIRQRGLQYLGFLPYSTNGLVSEDGLASTMELVFDVDFVRSTFRPIDLANRVGQFQGRAVDFDIFLHAQAMRGRRDILPAGIETIVHPSQMICQYVVLRHRPRRRLPPANNILLIPYFFYLGGEESLIENLIGRMRASDGRVSLFGRRYDVASLSTAHAAWIRKQAFCVERAVAGRVRPVVNEYFGLIQSIVASRAASAKRPPAPQRV